MKLYELSEGQKFQIVISLNDQKMEFDSEVVNCVPRKHLIYATPIIKNDRILSFNAPGLSADVVVSSDEAKPLLFRNVSISTLKDSGGTFYYGIASAGDGVVFNRRNVFRCFIDIPAVLNLGTGHKTRDIIVRDVSINGFSFCFTDPNETTEIHIPVHTVLNDYIDVLYENFSFHLFGEIVREQTLENGRKIYGCKLDHELFGMDNYIAKKERIRLAKQRGTESDRREREKNEDRRNAIIEQLADLGDKISTDSGSQ